MAEKKEDIVLPGINLRFFIILFLGIFWLTFLPAVLIGYFYFTFFPFSFTLLDFLLLIPLFFVLFGVSLLSSLIVTRVGIWLVHKRIIYPKPGVYPISMDNPQMRAYIIKGNIKTTGRWLFNCFQLQFLRAIWLRNCGVKIGKHVKLPLYIHDEEFITIGDNTFLSKYCQISGHLMDQVALTLNETIVGKNVIMVNVTGAVGGEVGDNSIFTHVTGAMKGQVCRGNAVYQGVPCKKIKDNDLSEAEIKAIKQEIRKIDKTDFIEKKNAPIKISGLKMGLIKFTVVLGGIIFGFIFPFLYALVFSSFYSPTNTFVNILLLLPIPIVFLIALGFFVFGMAAFVKIFISHYDKKAEIPEGTYELDDPRAKIFKIKYLLRMFGLKLFHNTPIRIGDTFAMRLWGNVTFGKNIVLEDAIVDPQYIEIGDNVVMAGGARIHTHDIVEGKLYIKKVKIGNNAIIGAFCHIRPGVELVDGSVIAVAAWLRKNLKTKRPSLWLGKPAFELPIEMITQSAGVEKKIVDDKYDKLKQRHEQQKEIKQDEPE
jgi:acetyltransferase-like isoleucine patch superfamily enzyme